MCYIEDCEILCYRPKTNQEYYKKIQDIKKGDFVKTKYHGYKPVLLKVCQTISVYKSTFCANIFCLRKEKNKDLTKDLYLTGGHAIAVDEMTPEDQESVLKIWGVNQTIDDKLLLLAGCGADFEKIKKTKKYKSFHILLEPNETNIRYLIWANGILSESTTPLAFQSH